jgi:PelA/Pel-15E family pectate lyase
MLIFEELFVPLHPSFYVITMEMLEKILIKQMRLVMLIALMAMTGVLNAQILSNNQVLQQKDSAFFQTQESRRIGDQLLLYQRDTGGWPKNVNMVVPLTAAQKDSVIQQKMRLDDSTIDNKATTMQMVFLARLYQQTRDDRYAQAFRKAMEFLLGGQYDNGGWPQFWPKNRQYQVHITYNDNAIVNVLKIFRDVMKNKEPFDNDLVDEQIRERTAKAFDKGIDCILATQIVVNGEPTVWCQQHDAVTLKPAKARAYELPSFCTQESANLTFLLMQISKPDKRIVRAVNGAMKWFDEHKITGYKLEKCKVDGKTDLCLVEDSTASPLWARYYDLEKSEPFFCDRDGQPKRSIQEIGYERRNGYGWYNDQPQGLYERYETWVKKNKITNRVTFK